MAEQVIGGKECGEIDEEEGDDVDEWVDGDPEPSLEWCTTDCV